MSGASSGPSGGPRLLADDRWDGELLANVHPAGWSNPRPRGRYDLLVIGAGTAGLVTAAGAAALGARVALIERHLMGGDCLNVGCVPSKALVRAARACADVRGAAAFGVKVPGKPAVDFGEVMERVRRLRASLSAHDSAARFQGLGADVFLGAARFAGRDTVVVGEQTLRFGRAVIATGARPVVPSIPGLVQAGPLTNETVFALTTLPARLAVIGGGPLGCELAQAFARLGARVWQIEHNARLMPREDADAARVVERALARDGVQLVLGSRVREVRAEAGAKILMTERDGRDEELAVDAILIGAGRAPNVAGLGLDAAGVAHDERAGVQVDDFLRTTNRRIFAAGDVCSTHRFTHTADAMARIVIRNALFLGRERVSSLVIPWCTYTDPEIAHVGWYPEEAAARGVDIATFEVPLAGVDRAVLDGEDEGFLKVHARRRGGTIVGATLVSRHAGDLIAELAVAITAGVDLATLARTIHPYPTQAEVIRKAADAFQRTRLTPLVKRLAAVLLAWRR